MPSNPPFHATIVAGGAEHRRARALQLAMQLVCTGETAPCMECRHCRKVAQGIHPDVISLRRFMRESEQEGKPKVEHLREMRRDAFIRPNEARRKVYLIEPAEELNKPGQNALLKLLEEGPDYAAFLLLTARPGQLLETIRSRCAVVHAGEDAPQPPCEEALRYAAVLTGGSELDRVAFLVQLELEKPERSALEGFLLDLERMITDAIVGAVTGVFTLPEARTLSEAYPRSELLRLQEQLRRGRQMLPFNVGTGHLLGWLAAYQSLGGTV